MTPMPPELVTTAANFGPAATFIPVTSPSSTQRSDNHLLYMPASMIGWLILNNLVKGVEKTGSEDGIGVSGKLREGYDAVERSI